MVFSRGLKYCPVAQAEAEGFLEGPHPEPLVKKPDPQGNGTKRGVRSPLGAGDYHCSSYAFRRNEILQGAQSTLVGSE